MIDGKEMKREGGHLRLSYLQGDEVTDHMPRGDMHASLS